MTTQPDNQQSLPKAVGKSAANVFSRTLGRLFGAGLNKGAEKGFFGGNPGSARWTTRSGSTDWRLKLNIPTGSDLLQKIFFNRSGTDAQGTASTIMAPLQDTNGLCFPLTPTVLINHVANYSQLATTHANYPYYAYQNSEPASISIIGDFPVQNKSDAAYWVAALHFMRSVSKMFFGGEDATRGNPPPILQLNGYGNHVFNNVPVVLTNFTVDLRPDVDYIATTQGNTGFDYEFEAANGSRTFGGTVGELPTTWAPSLSTFTLQVQPVYSRETVKSFSMAKFVNGELYNGTTERPGIGFI